MTAAVATLSMMLYDGLNPRFAKYAMLCLKASTMVSLFAFAMGCARIAFVVQSYKMNNACIPCIEVMGNFPVKSAYIVPTFLSMYPRERNI